MTPPVGRDGLVESLANSAAQWPGNPLLLRVEGLPRANDPELLADAASAVPSH